MVGLEIEGLLECFPVVSENQLQHAHDGPVQIGFVQKTCPDGLGDELVVPAARGRHFQVQSGGDSGDPVMDRPPVGHHQAVEAPFLAQRLGQEPAVLGRVDVVDSVVRAHQRCRVRSLDYSFEYTEVHFPQGSFIDSRIYAHSIGFLIVGGEVFHRGPDPSGLDACYQGGSQFSRQQRVLREIFEVPSAQRGTFQVYARSQDHADALRLRLLGQRPPDLFEQRHIPGGRKCCGRGETCCRH